MPKNGSADSGGEIQSTVQLLRRRFRATVLAVLLPLSIVTLFVILALSENDRSNRYAQAFANLSDALVQLGTEISIAANIEDDHRDQPGAVASSAHIAAFRLAYRNMLTSYGALLVADPDGDQIVERDAQTTPITRRLQDVFAYHEIDPASANRELKIVIGGMPELLSELWEDSAWSETGISNGKLESEIGELVFLIDPFLREDNLSILDRPEFAISINEYVSQNISGPLMDLDDVLKAQAEWTAGVPFFAVLALFLLVIGAMTFARFFILPPLEDEIMGTQAKLLQTRKTSSHINRLLDEVLAEMGEGLMILSEGDVEDRKTIRLNSKLAELMELPEDMARLGVRDADLLKFFEERGDFDEHELQKLNAYRRDPEANSELNLLFRLPSGRTMRSVGRDRADGAGRIVTFSDISDIVQSEKDRAELAENLGHMQRLQAVGQLTGGVAHDFNNLLAVVMGNAELLQLELGKDNESLDYILKATERGTELTGRLLAFSRKQALKPVAIDLNEKMDEIRALLKRTLSDNIEIQAMPLPGLWSCMVDPSQLENAILNLAVNARDAMPDGGVMTIETANVILNADYATSYAEVTPGPYVLIAISDTGEGMSKDVLDHVFEPFFTTKRVGEGSGLGLSMVFGFVKQSKGHVTIKSEPGYGTTVKLYLPRSNLKPGQSAAEVAAIPRAKPHEKVMIVEDDPAVRSLAVRLVRTLGYEVTVFESAPSALASLAEREPFDLLLTDVMLPDGMNGVELAREMRRRRPDITVVYMSGNPENAFGDQTPDEEEFALLQKPFTMSEIAMVLRAALDEVSV